jgi:flagellin-like hook-associated protein FlgL
MSVTLAQRRSENDDTDMAQAAVDLQNENNVYEASLAASARLFGASLLDFLK